MHVVATAGHVDHGKSTLVRALTGTDPDRLTEEKERGLTIDLGFASMPLPSGRQIAFIDVPGHVRFLKNMLAGVSGVDACVFVVDVTEGWKPQSEEHLRILQLLGLRHGMVALTKADEGDDDLVELARLDVAEHVAGTFLADAPIMATDAVTGTGIDALIGALDDLLALAPTAADLQRPRLWVDRAFAIKGSGTVVTGTLTGGGLAADDTLAMLPAGRSVRVRALQSLHQQCDQIGPGNRVAVNIVGAGHRDVARGDALVRSEQWHATAAIDAELSVLASLDHPVTRRGAYVAYIGSGEHPVRLRVLGPAAIEPGRTGLVRLHLPLRLPLCMGDRFILRESGRSETVGGGEVLDVEPVLPAARARPDRSVERIISGAGAHRRRTPGEAHRHRPPAGYGTVGGSARAPGADQATADRGRGGGRTARSRPGRTRRLRAGRDRHHRRHRHVRGAGPCSRRRRSPGRPSVREGGRGRSVRAACSQ